MAWYNTESLCILSYHHSLSQKAIGLEVKEVSFSSGLVINLL
jgi:hypothetical protein